MPIAPLTTIEEQEDQRILEKAHKQARKESTSRSHEQYDVGRTTTLSPDKPVQLLPTVTLEASDSAGDTTIVSSITGQSGPLVESPKSDSPQLCEKKVDGDILPVQI